MTKDDLAETVLKTSRVASRAAATDVVRAVFGDIVDSLSKGDEVRIAGLGSFTVKQRKARKCRNPQSGEIIDVAAKKGVVFKAAADLKRSVNAKKR